MAAPVHLLAFICSANLVWRVSSDGSATVECPPVNYGTFGRDCRLQCSVKGPNILGVVWKRVRPGAPLSAASFFSIGGGDGQRLQSGWDRRGTGAWLQVRNVQVEDEGVYTCVVLTGRGSVERSTSLKVVARYSEPTLWSVPERNVEEDMPVTMFCSALGGFPRGTIHWFDQYGTNWTRSARTDARERGDGRFDLASEFGVWQASSLSPGYRCHVISGGGGKEGEAEIQLAFRDPEKRVQRWSDNSIAAVIVVAGSLTTGLLLLLLLQRRRPWHEVYVEEEDVQNTEECPQTEQEERTSC